MHLPGSKSITNRAFLCAALARGKSRIYGALESDDTQVMLNSLEKLEIRNPKFEGGVIIEGNGGKFKAGDVTLDAGASGTTTRFLTALAVLRNGKTHIQGTKRMEERPMADLTEAIQQIEAGKRTIAIKGSTSSQFLSALLMISPALAEPIQIEVIGKLVSKPYIDTTLAVMKAFGVKVKHDDHKTFYIQPQTYRGTDYRVEGDASAASYFSSLNFLHGGHLSFENLNYKKSIQGDVNFPEALKKLRVKSSKLRVIDMEAMPDAALTLAVTAPFASGRTKITGLATLRLKETDRLKALETELRKVWVKVSTTKDSITVEGPIGTPSKVQSIGKSIGPSIGSSIGTYDDHRMAMSFAVLGTMVSGVVIEDPDCTTKTYPNFWEDLERAYLSPIKLGTKNLVLIGMRCSGKNYHGAKIAKLLGRKFIDLDLEIEKAEKMKISEIVKLKGWGYFREAEQKICSAFAKASSDKSFVPSVIATGGGMVLDSKNMKAFQQHSVVVFIYADPHVLLDRIKKTPLARPSLTGKKIEHEIHELWEHRRPLYLKYADYVWDDTSGLILGRHYREIFLATKRRHNETTKQRHNDTAK